ncbi:alpha-hydroxy-acid oxidizing protein [Pigmentiphaga sp. H8]|uniref:alpha-hydroxy acid oxidase n=1 Tax=Pigmentiphaga sp. H8 TaxID=2488560 RepID=UPI000F58F600|nr:alpha-hydroxy acid oxidase [Pigmentiphaga sp. H8]AZG06971.1 alpha-hydroxy-acid oxidizing protein [Pigmentiphaga sp. H8]
MLALADFEREARRRLPRSIYGFAAHGAEDERSVRANAEALSRLELVPRVLVDVGARSTRCELWGREYRAPFGIAPMGGAALFAYRADLALAEAAAAEQVPFVLSAASSVPLETIAARSPGAWYQAYLPGDSGRIDGLLQRLERAGIEVLVVTADVPVAANRENDLRQGFGIPVTPGPRLLGDVLAHPRWMASVVLRTLLRDGIPRFENFGADRGGPIVAPPSPGFRVGRDRLTWDNLRHIRRRWRGRLLVKGILHEDDARAALDAGVDGMILSNHGGRQLDSAVSPLRMLPRIAALRGGAKLIVDGGFRRGTDVIKALALGADFVLIGRPFLYAASVGATAGVRRAIGLLHAELDRDLALIGRADIRDIDASCLAPGSRPNPPFEPRNAALSHMEQP